MKKSESLGRKLSREEQKKIIGGNPPPPGCSISADCYKDIYNSTTHNYDRTKVGTVTCDGSGACSSTSTQVSCEQSSGNPDTSTCPPGAWIA